MVMSSRSGKHKNADFSGSGGGGVGDGGDGSDEDWRPQAGCTFTWVIFIACHDCAHVVMRTVSTFALAKVFGS